MQIECPVLLCAPEVACNACVVWKLEYQKGANGKNQWGWNKIKKGKGNDFQYNFKRENCYY